MELRSSEKIPTARKTSCQMQSHFSRYSLEWHHETQKLRGCATWPICARQGSWPSRIMSTKCPWQKKQKNKKTKPALNVYKGQRKPVQNDIDAKKVVLSCPHPNFQCCQRRSRKYERRGEGLSGRIHKVTMLPSSRSSSVGFLPGWRKWEALTFYAISTYDYYMGLGILITDRRLFLELKVSRSS